VVRIAMASTDEILQGTAASVKDAMTGFPEGRRPEGALISACSTRNWLLGSRTSSDLDIIRNGLGSGVPLAGFYAFGEIAPLQLEAAPKFHNETCVTLLIGT
jgi:small ligand-binding sensory domain FIST